MRECNACQIRPLQLHQSRKHELELREFRISASANSHVQKRVLMSEADLTHEDSDGRAKIMENRRAACQPVRERDVLCYSKTAGENMQKDYRTEQRRAFKACCPLPSYSPLLTFCSGGVLRIRRSLPLNPKLTWNAGTENNLTALL
jgi:hypothetical protein